MGTEHCNLSYEDVDEAFLKAPPLITSTIKDKSVVIPNFYVDLPEYKPFPLGAGVTMTELIFRQDLPEYEVGLGKWRKLNGEAGCSDCPGPDCSYNTTTLGGHSFESKVMSMMRRDYRSQEYCISQIQTTYQFETVFAKVVEGLYRDVQFIKEFNVVQNVLQMLTKKFVVDSDGFKINTADPYSFPNVGTTILSVLNIHIVTRFYQWMRRLPDIEPYDMVDGKPVFAISASDEIFADMYRDDPQLREDLRFSGYANALLEKYNFMYSIRGMFMVVPQLYPFRYNIVAGEVLQVAPFVSGVPSEVGSYGAPNPAYENATHEGVLFHGKNPFSLYYMPTATSLGQNTSFGPEFSWFDNWMWINPLTKEDPFRRSGFFVTSATLGVGADRSEGLFQLLVPRTGTGALFTQGRQPVCPVDPPTCDNSIPATGCPCPQLAQLPVANPITAGRYYLQFAVPIDTTVAATVVVTLSNGGSVSGTVIAISADGYTLDVDFGATFDAGLCNLFTSINCVDLRVCQAAVLGGSDCRADQIGSIQLILEAPIKADVADVVTAIFCDGTTTSLTIAAADVVNSTYNLSYATGFGPTDNPTGLILSNTNGFFPNMNDFCCDRGLPVSICVPTAVEATCPGCTSGPVITQCAED